MPTVAPCEIQTYEVSNPIFVESSIAFSVAITDFDGLYTPGARVAVMFATPTAIGISPVEAYPL
jgi:hypothetical protein